MHIRKVMCFNGYPHYARLTSDVLKIRKILRTITHLYSKILSQFFSRTPHARVQGEHWLKIWSEELKDTLICQLSYCNAKEKVSDHLKSQIMYEFCCPACDNKLY